MVSGTPAQPDTPARKVSPPGAARRLAASDPVIARLVRDYGPPRFPVAKDTHFATLVRAITYQQLAGAAATAIHGRLVDALAGDVRPDRLLALSTETLRSVGLSMNKMASLRDLSTKVLDGTVVLEPRRLARLSDDEIMTRLASVRGIGRWTAQIFLMFQLRRPDVWPTGDLGVRRGYGLAWKIPQPTEKQLDVLGEPYRPYRTVVAWYCWRAAEANVGQKATEIDEAVPAKVKEYLDVDEPNYAGLIHWVNTTFPLGLTKEKAQFDTRAVDENAQFLVEKIKDAYQRKSSHEEPTAVKSLERYIILNAIDRLWQEHLYAMDALREGVYLRGYAQKDPLIEYKTEAYDMFVELMANIKSEVLNNLFRSTSNLQAFENFLATLPQFLMREHAPTAPTASADARMRQPVGAMAGVAAGDGDGAGAGEVSIDLPVRRSVPKVGRNEPCPCGSGKKYKNCCGRVA